MVWTCMCTKQLLLFATYRVLRCYTSPWLQPFPTINAESFRFYQIFFSCHPFFLFRLFYILRSETQCVSTMPSAPLFPVSSGETVAMMWISSVAVVIVTVYAVHITQTLMIKRSTKSGVGFLDEKSSLCLRLKYLVATSPFMEHCYDL